MLGSSCLDALPTPQLDASRELRQLARGNSMLLEVTPFMRIYGRRLPFVGPFSALSCDGLVGKREA